MKRHRLFLLTLLALLAFAGNSLLCRLALRDTAIDPATFTSIRIVSGALALWLIVRWRDGAQPLAGSWLSALALFAYAAAFSFSYVSLTAATGALLLFGAVQATMIGYGRWRGDRLRGWQPVGFILAVAGLVGLLLPGLQAPPLHGSLLMLLAGVAWGVYSLRAKGSGDPLRVTAGNFVRAIALAALLSAATFASARIDAVGVAYAIASGALASGVGYTLWYMALPHLAAWRAALLQMTVPVITAIAASVFLAEVITPRLLASAALVTAGVALSIRWAQRRRF
jgi:drug/metabolite transporter (DMT)-like permease